MIKSKIYYHLKPFLSRRMQIAVRRIFARRKRFLCKDVWPIDTNSLKIPDKWVSWPNDKQFAFVLTHDVESEKGLKKCSALLEVEEKRGFRSSFNFVIKDYIVPVELLQALVRRGFEVGVHGFTHKQRLIQSEKSFLAQYPIINQYLKEWGAVGYRAPSMLNNLDWMHKLNIEYDASTFDTDPFEPKPIGVKTIFPFWVESNSPDGGYVELPYTLPQDFTLFIILQEKSIDIWARKLDWIAQHGGMALLNIHPDYINFEGKDDVLEEYPVQLYENLLEYVQSKYTGQYWHVLPKDMARFWSGRCR